MEYRHGSHTVYDVKYHIVWVTKYRYQVLQGEIAIRTRELVRQTCMSQDVTIVKGSVGRDHVHVLLSCPPSIAPAKIVQYLKGRTSRLLQEEYPQLKKRYWGRHLWSRGYFCATVGAVTEELIKDYIADQDVEDGRDDFKVVDEFQSKP